MEKVLLAIDGTTPDKRAFDYAVQLCKRIKAELNVLQVIHPKKYGEYLAQARRKTGPAKRYVEGSLMAAAFAEAGAHDTANELMTEALRAFREMMPESEKQIVPFRLTMKSGNPGAEIVDYLKEHRDVVLTIYDAGHRKRADNGFAGRFEGITQKIQEALSIPLVVIRSS